MSDPQDDQQVGVGLIGHGTVGQGVARLLHEHRSQYARLLGRVPVVKRVLVRDPAKHGDAVHVDPSTLTADSAAFLDTPGLQIVVEVAGGRGPVGEIVRASLRRGLPVITANKSLLAAEGESLFALARDSDACIGFEASCAGGLPVVTAIQFGLKAGRIAGLYGILNGTCNYILTGMSQRGDAYADCLAQAQAAGYAEADPTLDISGRDAAEKLAILATLAFGVRVDVESVACEGISDLALEDIRFGSAMGYDVKLLAVAERQGGADGSGSLALSVRPCFVSKQDPLANVHGSFNALVVDSGAVGPTMYIGRGAGQLPTAGAVVSDLLNVVSGWYGRAFAAQTSWPDQVPRAETASMDEVRSRYYLRLSARDVPGVFAHISALLGDAGISLGALRQYEVAEGQFVPVVIVTHAAREGDLRQALQAIAALDVTAGTPVCLRIMEAVGYVEDRRNLSRSPMPKS